MPRPGTPVTELSVEIQGSIATVVFASPSLRRTFQEDLWRTMDALEANPDIAVVVFTGRRNVFMTGADLGEILALERPAFGGGVPRSAAFHRGSILPLQKDPDRGD